MTPSTPPPPPKIGMRHGWHWFTGALGMVRRYPTVFLPMGLIVGCIDLFPLIGPLIVLFLGPTFLAGVCVAAYTVSEGHPPALRQLFALFQPSQQRHEAFKLCIPLVLGKLAAGMILAFALLHQAAAQGIKLSALRQNPHELWTFIAGDAMRPWLLLALAIFLLAWTLTALAIPHVALSAQPAYTSMGKSFKQIWRHLAAWIVAAAALFACLILIAWLLELTRIALIMKLGIFTFLYAVLGPMLYLAWRDHGGTPTTHDANTPPAPPSPPPPSGVLEA